MSAEEYELLPMHPGWKIEYWNGQAHYEPRWYFAVGRVEVALRRVESPLLIKPLSPDYEQSLASAYCEAFCDAFDYCDWETGRIVESADKCIHDFLVGKRGEVLPASRMAIDETSNSVAGAALVKRGVDEFPLLDFLFVRPGWQRRGLATALVSAVVNELHGAGESVLQSCYRLGNDESVAWHRRFGFVEEPDLRIAQLHLTCAQHELWRREKIGDLADGEHGRLAAECARLRTLIDELEAIEDQFGFDAVSPMSRHG